MKRSLMDELVVETEMLQDVLYQMPIMRIENIVGVMFAAAGILLIPLIAMQYSSEVNWDLFDFVAMWVLLTGAGLSYLFVSTRSGSIAYRLAAGIGVGTTLLLIWMNLAVGIIGSEDNPANLLYGAVLVVGGAGALIARCKPAGMAKTLFVAAATQMLVPVVALMIWKPELTLEVLAIFVLNGFFATLFVVSGLLFKKAM